MVATLLDAKAYCWEMTRPICCAAVLCGDDRHDADSFGSGETQGAFAETILLLVSNCKRRVQPGRFVGAGFKDL